MPCIHLFPSLLSCTQLYIHSILSSHRASLYFLYSNISQFIEDITPTFFYLFSCQSSIYSIFACCLWFLPQLKKLTNKTWFLPGYNARLFCLTYASPCFLALSSFYGLTEKDALNQRQKYEQKKKKKKGAAKKRWI